MLEDTLVIWGGEFGRTSYCQGKIQPNNFGRDHHHKTFHGVDGWRRRQCRALSRRDRRIQLQRGERRRAHSRFPRHDSGFAGIDHEKLTYKYQGRHFRLTDVRGHVVKDLVSYSPEQSKNSILLLRDAIFERHRKPSQATRGEAT